MSISFNLIDAVIAIVNFLILYIILNKVLFKPVMKAMKERSEGIEKSIRDNEERQKSLDILTVQYQGMLAEQDKMARKLIEETRDKASLEYKKIIEEAKLKSAELQKDAINNIERERKEMIQKEKETITSLSVLIASKVLEENIDTSKNKELADKFIREVSE